MVGHSLPHYESVLKSCKDKPGTVLPLDLPFVTKLLAVYLFIKVKGLRPMTHQYLTIVEMVNKAKTNGGFIDQKMFKTAGKYGFDFLFLTDTSMQVLNGYINHIHPLLKPTCDYVLVTRNGGQHNKLGDLMSKLVFDATGKYVHLTRSLMSNIHKWIRFVKTPSPIVPLVKDYNLSNKPYDLYHWNEW